MVYDWTKDRLSWLKCWKLIGEWSWLRNIEEEIWKTRKVDWQWKLNKEESWLMITCFDDKQMYLETTLVHELFLIGLSFWNCVLLKKKIIAWSLGINLFLEYCPLCYSEHDCINPNVVKLVNICTEHTFIMVNKFLLVFRWNTDWKILANMICSS